jgi:hypothetical protein
MPDRSVEQSTRKGRNWSRERRSGSLRLGLGDKSRMKRELPVRFREGLGVQFPRATRLAFAVALYLGLANAVEEHRHS